MSRWRYFGRRVALSIPVLLFAMSLVFLITRAGPADPVRNIIGATSGLGDYHRIAVRLGIERRVTVGGEVQYVDVPLWRQYIGFMTDFLTLNLGKAWVVSSLPVVELIATRAPRTIWLGFWSVLIALFVGIPLGFYAGLNPNTRSDYLASFGGIVWRAMPNFWLAVILVELLSNTRRLFGFSWQGLFVQTTIIRAPDLDFLAEPAMFVTAPAEALTGFVAALKVVLPAALVLGSSSMGNEMRIGRTAVLETINSNYVETARAKGLSERAIVWKHVFRNALIPLVPIITGEAFLLIGGSIIVETVFSYNGIGQLFFQAALQGDLPLVGALAFIFIVLTLVLNILQDLLYTIIDPRVGYDE